MHTSDSKICFNVEVVDYMRSLIVASKFLIILLISGVIFSK